MSIYKIKDSIANWLTDGELYSNRLTLKGLSEDVNKWIHVINDTSPKHPQMKYARERINSYLKGPVFSSPYEEYDV